MPTLICDCNKTMPLDPKALGRALNEDLTLHSALCRREAGAFVQAARAGEELVVACTQERALFSELAQTAAGEQGRVAPLRFVNIRETGGWGRDASRAGPKMAALLQMARLPDPEPVPTVTYRSSGRLLIIGPVDAAEQAGALVADTLQVTVFSTGPGQAGGAQSRRFPVLGGRITRLEGWLGRFELAWEADNPIDLDLCTRCNACIVACPEDAIGLDYQVNLDACRSHRACVRACSVAGAIDFDRAADPHSENFDLVLDLRSPAATPTFNRHALPQGYFRSQGVDAAVLLQLRELVGEFEKPRFFSYKQKLCAHARNEKLGCNACVDICSAEAITSDKSRQKIEVNPNLCVGCGACTTVCPTGALTYAYPRASEQGGRVRALLAAHAAAGGRDPVVLLHSEGAGTALVEALGRAARLGVADGMPANVLPVPLWHVASTGIEVWLSLVGFGASQVALLATGEEAPQYLEALDVQLETAQAILNGLGYAGRHFHLLRAGDATGLDESLRVLARTRQTVPAQRARFAIGQEKRVTLDQALDHLMEQAPALPAQPIALPQGAPLGSLEVDASRCTLCLSCVSACPASALQDTPERPQLRFIERNCVQCGLCATTCPEDAISLTARLLPGPARRQPRVLNETQPYACIRCSKPFGTLQAIEAMLGRLSGHPMFQGAALDRLKMCGDCRVIDIYSAPGETKITDL